MRSEAKVQKSCTSLILELPYELIVQILSRLPLKSLVQCKSVCKQWREIFADPYFASIYMNDPTLKTFFLYFGQQPDVYMLEISETGDCIGTNFVPKLQKSSRFLPSYLELIGSCNGLLCFLSLTNEKIYVCNPMTMVSNSVRTIPRSHPSQKEEYSGVRYLFGYCRAIDKYKILRIYYNYKEIKSIMILTLGDADGWRFLPKGLFNIRKDINALDVNPAAILNGVYHWTMANRREYLEDGISHCIYTFDMEKETRGTLPCPGCLSDINPLSYKEWLSVSKDQLFLTENYHGALTIWTMKEYGVEDSWTKIAVFGGVWGNSDYGIWYAFPITIMECGVIVITVDDDGTKLWVCDPTNKTHKKIKDLVDSDPLVIDLYTPNFSPLLSFPSCDVKKRGKSNALKQ